MQNDINRRRVEELRFLAEVAQNSGNDIRAKVLKEYADTLEEIVNAR